MDDNLIKLIKTSYQDNIRYKRVSDIATYKDGAAHEHIMSDNGKYVVAKVKFISTDGKYRMYSDVRLSPVEKDDIIMVMSDLPRGKSLAKCYIIEQNDKYTINQRVCSLTVNKEEVLPKYFYYVLNRNEQLLKYDNGYNQTHLKKQYILNVVIPIPPISIQREIVEILDTFNEIISKLSTEYELREKQYEYCRIKMFDFNDAEYQKLGDCCLLEKGKTPIQKAVPGEYPLVVTASERKSSRNYQFNSATVCVPLVSSRGHGVAAMNQVFYQTGKFALGNILCGVTPQDSSRLNAKYLYYYLNHKKDILLVPLMRGGANVSLTVNTLKGVEVPIPPYITQQKIINMLEPFDDLLTSISKEINYRNTQFEYYKKMLIKNVK